MINMQDFYDYCFREFNLNENAVDYFILSCEEEILYIIERSRSK